MDKHWLIAQVTMPSIVILVVYTTAILKFHHSFISQTPVECQLCAEHHCKHL